MKNLLIKLFTKVNKSKTLLNILSIIGLVLALIFGDKYNDAYIEIAKEKLKTEQVEIENSQLELQYGDLVSFCNNLQCLLDSAANDTIHVTVHDTIEKTTYKDSITFRDSVIYKIIESTKPVWGSISFKDSSNIYTNVDCIVDFPYGRRTLFYTNKVKEKSWLKKWAGVAKIKDIYFPFAGVGVGKFGINIGFSDREMMYSVIMRY